eukprot:Protomagalhaensia_sp_Gyna_25__5569@NODE_761_length_2675_cov_24_925266_g597_i0_p2_GENE_NODE_761_length_2675_cov_24_925266_g597_i0NODE_761_length_2675_cov_24_925266_g597_i0_p2_ORF_typecomplete_len171_score13_25Peptidase_S26/PF10502_9/2_6Peptidase_S26/PF10502_9/7_7e08Peptidase_S24/PF00717_23/4_6e10CHASE9/PF17153_4/0_014Peptidase_S3/PF00944_19/1_1e02Peptidase_S3/PF00944_19/4_7_NODE_761_length_2675_cov_24_925266_g597_i06561168
MWKQNAAVALLLGGTFQAFRKTLSLVETRGASMVPAIEATGGVLLVDRVWWRFSRLKRDDIVIFYQKQREPPILACKRIVGLGGQTVIRNRVMFYVPKSHLWLEGDKPECSKDSRYYGSVDSYDVWGRVVDIKLGSTLQSTKACLPVGQLVNRGIEVWNKWLNQGLQFTG